MMLLSFIIILPSVILPIINFKCIGHVSYGLLKDEYEIILDIKEDLIPNDDTQVMDIIPNKNGEKFFMRK